jgi:5-methylcytosine-specific restriction protein A
MPTQPAKFSFVKRQPVKAWSTPGKNAHRRTRGRALQRERQQILAEEPLCRACLEAGRITVAEEIDHIRDDLPDDEWNARENKQPLCKPCHLAKTARERAEAQRAES